MAVNNRAPEVAVGGMSWARHRELMDLAELHMGTIGLERTTFIDELRKVPVDRLGDVVVLYPPEDWVQGQQQLEFKKEEV